MVKRPKRRKMRKRRKRRNNVLVALRRTPSSISGGARTFTRTSWLGATRSAPKAPFAPTLRTTPEESTPVDTPHAIKKGVASGPLLGGAGSTNTNQCLPRPQGRPQGKSVLFNKRIQSL